MEDQQVEGYIITFIEEFFTLQDNSELIYENFALLHDFSNIRILKTSESIYQFVDNLYDLVWREFSNGEDKFQSKIFQNLVTTIFFYLKRVNFELIQELNIKDKKYYALAFKFRALIRNNTTVQTSLSYYLEQLNVSQSTLQKATKIIFNRTPKELIDENIISAAKGLLADQFKRVSEISELLGFSEPTNFTKFFKKLTGYTPENYRVLY